MSKMMRISNETSQHLDELSTDKKIPKQKIIEKAVEMFARKYFLIKTNKEYSELKKNTKNWQHELDELEEWDTTLLDHLEK